MSRRNTIVDDVWSEHKRGDVLQPGPRSPISKAGSQANAPKTEAKRVPRARALAAYQPFPLAALPAPVDEYVRQGGIALGCDPAFVALPALAVIASCIGNTRTIRLKRGWAEPAVIWSALVADSGTMKSPAYLQAVDYLFGLQKQKLTAFREEQKRYEADSAGSTDKPRLERVVCCDTTIEKLAEILEDNPRGTLVARDELAGWLGSFTRYKTRGGTDLPNWLEMHRAGTIVVDRKTSERPTLFISRAAVSVTGGIQPGVLARSLTAEFLESGLAARLLMAMPPKLPKRWSDVEIAPETEQAYRDTLDKLLALEFDDRDGERIPHALPLSPQAKTAWVGFFDEWAQRQSAAEGERASLLAKLEAYAARFSLVHHVVSCTYHNIDDRTSIGAESIDAGAALCRWFASEAERIYSTFSESTEERECRRLVEFIQSRGGRVTARDLQNSNSRKYKTTNHADAALGELVQTGLAAWDDIRNARGGRPTRFCVLLPTPDNTDTT